MSNRLWAWFGKRYVTFLQPILSPDLASWRTGHIPAHIIGGIIWDGLLFYPTRWSAYGLSIDFTDAWWGVRVLWSGLWQMTVWEWNQHENWRPELMGLPAGTGYPWLSAIWDTLFAMLGALLFEWGLALLT